MKTKCKHFTGILNDRCGAGMVYRPGKLDECVDYGPGVVITCPHAQYPTPEEVEAAELELKARLE